MESKESGAGGRRIVGEGGESGESGDGGRVRHLSPPEPSAELCGVRLV